MIQLARGVAIPGVHTSLAHLETSATILTALGAAAGSRIFMIIHFKSPIRTLLDYPTVFWRVSFAATTSWR
jgi:hypothetical protein